MDLTVPLSEAAWNKMQAGRQVTVQVTAPGDVTVHVTVLLPPQLLKRMAAEPGA